MSAVTPSTHRPGSRRRRNYSRLQTDQKAETRSKYITASILGLILFALLASLGVIAANAGH
ncbi:hypothetical protein [Hymenobacter rubripertinctus]|uniref:Uncharacterized protein n=1 Tax=Hymenobacter rubripertinctus TaxID=2029981 RepID=A0A418QRQ1_9BACT|nr:hypothetical protein [Hymenobacter rubripertinctus]RIY07957.1 hypothetical protein D0T11_15415 [Hymenobacter rubripertinctus]